MLKIKDKALDILPLFLTDFLIKLKNMPRRASENKIIKNDTNLYDIALDKIIQKARNNEVIKVAFFVEYSSIWKLELVYKLFEQDERFVPIIVIVPVVTFGYENMIYEMDKSYTNFKNQGYQVIKSYDEKENKYINIKETIKPDIIFYTRPYRETVDENYYIANYLDILTCYVDYAYQVTTYEKAVYDAFLPNVVWKFFLATELHLESFYSQSRNLAINGVVTGYPGVDQLLYKEKVNDSNWKSKNKKKIIWAPHYTIGDKSALTYSNFLAYSEKMLELANNYKDEIQISFKPHPALKSSLYKHKDWGKKRTDDYYKSWELGYNTQLNTDSYIDLFNSSDALIHDSGSFTAEYLHCGKPLLFTMRKNAEKQFNDFGKLALEAHYHAYHIDEIEKFIVDVVLNGNDYMEEKRDNIYGNILQNNSQSSASENIYNYICNQLFIN